MPKTESEFIPLSKYTDALASNIAQLKSDFINGNLRDFRTGLIALDPTCIPYAVAMLFSELPKSERVHLIGQFRILTNIL